VLRRSSVLGALPLGAGRTATPTVQRHVCAMEPRGLSSMSATLLDANAICACLRSKFDRYLMVGASHTHIDDSVSGKCSLDNVRRKHYTIWKKNMHLYVRKKTICRNNTWKKQHSAIPDWR